jgi:hypothetical protein
MLPIYVAIVLALHRFYHVTPLHYIILIVYQCNANLNFSALQTARLTQHHLHPAGSNSGTASICYLLSVVCCLPSAVCYLLSAICYLLSAVCCLLSAVCCLLSAVCCLLSAVNRVLSAVPVPRRINKEQQPHDECL